MALVVHEIAGPRISREAHRLVMSRNVQNCLRDRGAIRFGSFRSGVVLHRQSWQGRLPYKAIKYGGANHGDTSQQIQSSQAMLSESECLHICSDVKVSEACSRDRGSLEISEARDLEAPRSRRCLISDPSQRINQSANSHEVDTAASELVYEGDLHARTLYGSLEFNSRRV